MKKIDLASARVRTGSGYPAPFHEPCMNRMRVALGDAAGLTQFGVNRLTLTPGSWSAQRHWHTAEDELVYVIEGEVVLVTDSGEETLRAGDAAGFRAGDRDGHHLVNRSTRDAVVLEIRVAPPGRWGRLPGHRSGDPGRGPGLPSPGRDEVPAPQVRSPPRQEVAVPWRAPPLRMPMGRPTRLHDRAADRASRPAER